MKKKINDIVALPLFLDPSVYTVANLHHPLRSTADITIERTWCREHQYSVYHKVPKSWKRMWAIRLDGMVFTKSKDWVWEPRPSERTDTFIKNTRFPTAEAAFKFVGDAFKWKEKIVTKLVG